MLRCMCRAPGAEAEGEPCSSAQPVLTNTEAPCAWGVRVLLEDESFVFEVLS